MKNVSEVERVMKEIMLKEVEPYLPFEFAHEGMLERVSALVQNQVRDRFSFIFVWLVADVFFRTGSGVERSPVVHKFNAFN